MSHGKSACEALQPTDGTAIGAGGFSQVREIVRGDVAIVAKFTPRCVAQEEHRILRAAQVSEFVVELYDGCLTAQHGVLVMERLHDAGDDDGALTAQVRGRITRHLVTGLSQLHAHDVTHGDIVEANIMFTEDPAQHPETFVAKFLDFAEGSAGANCTPTKKQGDVQALGRLLQELWSMPDDESVLALIADMKRGTISADEAVERLPPSCPGLTRAGGEGLQSGSGGMVRVQEIDGEERVVKYISKRQKHARREGTMMQRARRATGHAVKPILLCENSEDVVVVMERLAGGDLFDFLDQKARSLTPAVVLRLSFQLLGGLRQLHAAGVLHRDVKPENIGLTQDPSVAPATFVAKYMDFGHSCSVDVACADNAVTGTESYWAPEREAKNAGFFRELREGLYASDVWYAKQGVSHLRVPKDAVAALQDRWLAEQGDVFALGKSLKLVLDRRPRASAQPDETTTRLKQAVAHMMAKDPRDRPSLDEVVAFVWPEKRSDGF